MMSTDIKIFPSWGVLTKADYDKLERDMLDELRQFYTHRGYDWSNVKCSKSRLRELIDMVERRRLYLHVYHHDEHGNPMQMGELNETCLYCFWLLKRYPFFDTSDTDRDVNLILALELFNYGVHYTAIERRKQGGTDMPNLRPHITKHIEHALKFRDMSKESLMALAESLLYEES